MQQQKNFPKIALGTWSWGTGMYGGDQVFGNQLDEEQLKSVFDTAMNLGLNLWDTAYAYALGGSETILGQLAKNYKREDILLSTKFSPGLHTESENPVEEMLNGSLERLGTDYIDVYWIHNRNDIERWTPTMIPLLKSGKIKSVGVSNHTLDEIKRANEILSEAGYRISAVQNHFSLLHRASEEAGILDYCKENDITFYAYMVLEQGALSGRYSVENPLPENSGRGQTYNKILPQLEELTSEMRKIGEAKNSSEAQVAIAWAIAKHTLPIIGATKPSHIEDAKKATELTLTEEEVLRLETLAQKADVNTKGGWESNV
ncbi:MAG: aldo/keto reductase [Bergeyella zoohelcum]|nr:aldo/keto reductase [Bergeyella zoohelcum]